eukprot:COSAG05_NODE_2478_length_3011_cov_2.418613_3_plen_257_part_00
MFVYVCVCVCVCVCEYVLRDREKDLTPLDVYTHLCVRVLGGVAQSAAAGGADDEDGVSDPVSLRLRRDHLTRGDKQPLAELRPSSRYSSVADLDTHDARSNATAAGAGDSESRPRGNLAELLKTPPAVDTSELEFASVPVTWAGASGSGSLAAGGSAGGGAGGGVMKAELRGPLPKLRDFWWLARRYQESYWGAADEAARTLERDFPYPLACFTRGRVDGHLNFEHESMLGGAALYGHGVRPAVLIVIDPKEYLYL